MKKLLLGFYSGPIIIGLLVLPIVPVAIIIVTTATKHEYTADERKNLGRTQREQEQQSKTEIGTVAGPKAQPFKRLPSWDLYGREWCIILVPTPSSPRQVIETSRFVHWKYPKLAFFIVDTERAMGPFNTWARDDDKEFPSRWAKRHYFGIANEFIGRSGSPHWSLGPAGAFAGLFDNAPLE